MDMKDLINDRANKKFEELRAKMKLNLQQPVTEKRPDLTQEKLDQMMNSKHILTKNEIKEIRKDSELGEAVSKAEEIDEAFDYIGSLNLPPQLSLAIGLIISAHRTNKKEDIAKAVICLGEYANN